MARMIQFQFSLETEQYNALKQFCRHNDVDMSKLLRALIDKWMEENRSQLARMGVKYASNWIHMPWRMPYRYQRLPEQMQVKR